MVSLRSSRPCLAALALRLGHGVILPARATAARTWVAAAARGRARCRPGCRRRRTPRRRPRARARRRPPARIRATRSRWPTAYCGSRRPSAARARRRGRHRRARARRAGRRAPAPTRSASSRCSVGLLAVPADRGAQHDARRRRRRRGPSPTWRSEKVAALTDRPVDRRHEEARARSSVGQAAAAEGQRDEGHRRVLDPRQLRRRAGAHVGEQPGGGRGRGRRGRPRRRRSTSASRVGPTTSVQPPPAAGASSRTVGAGAHRRAPDGVGDGAGQPADAADEPGEDRARRRAGAAAAGGRRRAAATGPRVEQRHELGHGGAGGDLAGVAGVDAAEQRLDQPVDDLAAEPRRDQRADATSSAVERGRPAARASSAARASPARESTPLRRARAGRAGTPISGARQRAQRAAGPQRRARWSPGARRRSPSPTRAASATASGRRASIDSAPTSTATPADLADAQLAADAAASPRAR